MTSNISSIQWRSPMQFGKPYSTTSVKRSENKGTPKNAPKFPITPSISRSSQLSQTFLLILRNASLNNPLNIPFQNTIERKIFPQTVVGSPIILIVVSANFLRSRTSTNLPQKYDGVQEVEWEGDRASKTFKAGDGRRL